MFGGKKIKAGLLVLSLGLGLLVLSACGDTTNTPAPITQASNITPLPAQAGVTVVQPKVLRTSKDGYRALITFTEQPTLNDGMPTFLFFDSEDCTYCAQMQPIITDLKQLYQNRVRFADIDFNVGSNANLVRQFNIPGHPGFVVVDGKGKTIGRWVGVTPREELEASLKQVSTSI